MIGQASESVRQYTNRTAETLQDTARQTADQARARYKEAERFVQERPAESLAVCFGAGLVVGILVGMMLTSK